LNTSALSSFIRCADSGSFKRNVVPSRSAIVTVMPNQSRTCADLIDENGTSRCLATIASEPGVRARVVTELVGQHRTQLNHRQALQQRDSQARPPHFRVDLVGQPDLRRR
jgi:hypothetical protein